MKFKSRSSRQRCGAPIVRQALASSASGQSARDTFPMRGGCYGTDIYSLIGIVLVLYGLIGSPFVGTLVGHLYPKMAFVGLFPCPTLAFTFGMLLCTDARVPKYLLAIPFLWGLWGVTGIPPMWEDVGMVASAVLGTAMIVYRDRKMMIGHAPRPA